MDKQEIINEYRSLFERQGIKILSIKEYSNDDDIDIVIIEDTKYIIACKILLEKGFNLKNNLSKIRETDKDFFVNPNIQYKIHLHKMISWNTVPFSDKSMVFKRFLDKSKLTPEDEILIIAAHSIFENKRIVVEELNYYNYLIDNNKIDWAYIHDHAIRYNWERALKVFIKNVATQERFFTPRILNKVCWSKFYLDVIKFRWKYIPREFINYSIVDNLWCYKSARRDKKKHKKIKKGIIIFSGTDGSGKTTLSKYTTRHLNELGYKTKYLHGGNLLNIFKSNKSGDQNNGNVRKRSIMILLIGIKDLLALNILIVSGRLKNDFIVCDRYIFDTIAKLRYRYKYSRYFDIILSIFVPSINIWFQIDTDPLLTCQRDNDHSKDYHQEKKKIFQEIYNEFTTSYNIRIDTNKYLEESKKDLNKILENKILNKKDG